MTFQKRTKRGQVGIYLGIPLSVWRRSYRAWQQSGWWRFSPLADVTTPANRRHATMVLVATWLLPASWHKENAGRLLPIYYSNRRVYVNMWFDPLRILPKSR